jgi:hypothetical protein
MYGMTTRQTLVKNLEQVKAAIYFNLKQGKEASLIRLPRSRTTTENGSSIPDLDQYGMMQMPRLNTSTTPIYLSSLWF